MSFLRSLLARLRGGSGPAPAAPPEDAAAFRRRVEEAFESDDADRLATVLRTAPARGKELIRTYLGELGAAEGPERAHAVRRVTALVAVFDRALGDPEPLSWFRSADKSGGPLLAGHRLTQAQSAFHAGDLDRADRDAGNGLELLEGAAESSAVHALESTLLAVRGAIATRQGRWDDAREHFESSLNTARSSGRDDTLAAALLNLIDLNTRRARLSEDDDLMEEASAPASGTPYEDVLAKLMVERGVARTQAGDLPGAVAALDRAAELRPQWPFPVYQRGWARFLQGDSGGALEDYRACAERKRVFFTVQREIRCLEDVAAGRLAVDAYRSFCLLREHVQAKPAEVEEAAGRLLTAHPEFAPGHLLRAEARLAQRDAEGAREAAREALRHDPDPDTAAAALFFEWNVARVHGEEAAAKEAAERLHGAYADHPAAMIVDRLREADGRNLTLRWTFAMDGTLHLEELDPKSVTPPGRTPPSPESPG
ncbi:MAG TPA: hypothetical protein VKU85_20225 [bacterium]|nr:hypothetical protein [bacterium]